MEKIEISVLVDKDINTVWDKLTNPKHVTGWNFASDDWCCPFAENDLKVGGVFKSRMEAKDGSFGFDFEGVYTKVKAFESFSYELGDKRAVDVKLTQVNNKVKVTEVFDPENENPIEMQRAGWQAILNNFKDYCEK